MYISSYLVRYRVKQDRGSLREAGLSIHRAEQSLMNGRSRRLMQHSTVPASRGL